MSEILAQIANVAIIAFVLSSMVALGLSLTFAQIVEPLTNLRLVGLGLVANFVVAPAAAWAVARLLGLDDAMTLGLVLLGTAAGAPFLPKLAQLAKGDVAYSVGLMVLLMVVTVAYIPVVLVPLVEGVEVSAWDVARPLVFGMLVPLVVALLVRSRYEASAELAPHLNQVSTVSLALALVVALWLGLPDLLDAIGTGAFIAVLVFMAICLAAGYFLGSDPSQRWVTAFGTTQRNVSAALLIATTSFAGQPEVLIIVMVGAVLMAAVLLPLAAELGKRAEPAAARG